MASKLTRKVCLPGDTSVGRTSLARENVYAAFDDGYITTIGTRTVNKGMSPGTILLRM